MVANLNFSLESLAGAEASLAGTRLEGRRPSAEGEGKLQMTAE